ncbi:MAG: helix-turn-helix transcriptional regulator [Clostridium lundense]|nr:helix-turn-helix transcriptional regulator [Clostridium lundense]
MQNLQSFLINKRKELKLSLRNAADLIGISHSYLNTLEKGVDPRNNAPVNPTPETLQLISKAYNTSYEYLMRLSGYLNNESKDENKLTKEEADGLSEEFLNMLIKHGKIKSKDDLTPENIFSILNEIFQDIKKDTD